MTRVFKSAWIGKLTALGLLLVVAPAMASDRQRAVSKTTEPVHETVVELFSAMDEGTIEVDLIPRDATEANVIIRNTSDQPVSIRMPEAFAGVPVLAQAGAPGIGGGFGGGPGGFGGGGNFGGGGGFGGGGNQGFGGGFGGGGFGGGFGGGGGGFGGGGLGGGGGVFNIAPGKVGKVKVGVLCLEHGKEDPNPRVKYTIRPIESAVEDQRVIELCKLMGTADITHNVAQATAWHLTDDLSWEELAAKDKVRLSNGYVEKYFNYQELLFARQAVSVVEQAAEAYQSASTEGTSRDSQPIK